VWVDRLFLQLTGADLVYNSRKRGGDSADRYFKATEMIAGVKDMRFQALMPDVLHWLGVKKIDNMISMVRLSLTFPEGHVLLSYLHS
jgi:GTP cyclohydrolase II